MINAIELAIYKFNYWLERSSLTSRFLNMLTESVDLIEGANEDTQFSVNYYFFSQISVNYYFFG